MVLENNNAVTKMYWLEAGALPQAERNIVYLCRPEARWMKVIAGTSARRRVHDACTPSRGGGKQHLNCRANRCPSLSSDQIKSLAANTHQYHLLVVPRMTTVCTTLLSDLGVLGSIDVQEFQLGLIPLEKDLLSLESEDVWRKLALVSHSLVTLANPPLTCGSLPRMATTPPSTTWGKQS